MKSMKLSVLAISIMFLLAILIIPCTSYATKRFIQNSSEEEVTSILYPWTQSDGANCTVCWEAAIATVYAYWDDYTYQGHGPWELLIPNGDGGYANKLNYKSVTESLYNLSGEDCNGGGSSVVIMKSAGKKYTNDEGLGYSFIYDIDSAFIQDFGDIFWDRDIRNKIDNNIPVI